MPWASSLDLGGTIARVTDVLHARTGKPTGSVVDRYRYPAQEVELGRKGKLAMLGGERVGVPVAHDRAMRAVDIKKGRQTADTHPTAVFAKDVVGTKEQQEALLRFADDPDAQTCGTDLLFHRPPRLRTGDSAPRPGEDVVDAAVRLAMDLDRTTLAIQGPPGAGKTYAGARMIRALVRAGKKVGVTAVSHKVIRNLLDAVLEQDRQEAGARTEDDRGGALRLGHRCSPDDREEAAMASPVVEFADNADAFNALAAGNIQVLGGTAWLWSRHEATASLDVLFVDEAGQMSLANALAVSGAADSLVLLGDPQQLEQPQKGSHPDGVDVSALQHVLDDAVTMPAGRGLFMPTTWRLHPAICAFTSELFYDGKLTSRAGLEGQALVGTDGFAVAGLWSVTVEHDGNQNASMEEVDAVEWVVERLLGPSAHWMDGLFRKPAPQPVEPACGAQVLIQSRLECLDGLEELVATPFGRRRPLPVRRRKRPQHANQLVVAQLK